VSLRRALLLLSAIGLALPAFAAAAPASVATAAPPTVGIAAAPVAVPFPQVRAPSWILVDHATGRVLAEHDADASRPPASLTKIMTGYVVLGAINSGEVRWDDRARVSRRAWKAGRAGSRAFVRQGSTVRLTDLMRGMTVVSGNDAATALAERVGGSEAAFVERMNAASRALGLANTQWANPTGLDDPLQRTTARDLAELARRLIQQHPAGYAYYGGHLFEWDGVKQHNHNTLLAAPSAPEGSAPRFAGADGVKTGFTAAAGYCIVGSAVREGRRLIVVVLGSASGGSRGRDTRALLEWGFAERDGTPQQPLLDSTAPAPAR
jgi:D-alanyl-D-alanine carboxypeptidase (penicillin-binding protein 5/6)